MRDGFPISWIGFLGTGWDEPSSVSDLWAPPHHEYLPRLFVLLPFG